MDFLDAQGKVIRSFTSQQDAIVAADSVRGDSVRTARNDSIRRAGGTPDTTTRSEARSEETPPGDDGPPRRPPPPRVANKVGLNTFAWNLRYPDASVFQNMILWAGGTAGPVVLPGTYTVRMTVNGQSYQQPLNVVKDPRSAASDADLREQFNFLMRIHDKTNQANDAVKTIRSVKAQLADRAGRMPPDKSAAFAANTKVFTDQLSAIEREIYQVKNQSGQDPLNYPIRLNNKIAALSGVVGGTDARPTSQSYTVFNDLSGQLDRQLSAMRGSFIILSPINASLKAQGLPPIVPSTEEIKTIPSEAVPSGSGDDEVEK
jgi:hypothetical protein